MSDSKLEWEIRGKTIQELQSELESFGEKSLKVEISLDGGKTSKPISLVGKADNKCVLIYLES